MQIIIDIPEEEYNIARFRGIIHKDTIFEAIKNSTPLPKGHGRLIDADALIDSLGCSDRDIYCKATISEDAPTVIESDRGDENV